ncbi:MAG: ABC transporter ATP-binding protein [Brasilonema angustatum HA4187-MV1]|nr:ABC transporter ATP-binding protein [Brasilonema angustatum HA4187-MV1]
MSDTVIRVENLSKKYVLSHQQTGGSASYNSLRDKITDGTKSLGKKLLKPSAQKTSKPTREEFWALKDVSFEIKQGDRVGFLGRNGAGKSTLLKVLSRIIEPTKGRISIKGRVASLLEVGTGFHPELTGRENIFLNGAILGMSKVEIKRKFDEIVAFAEIEKFLDTPVKRYSSGMYVRLAFAVAAHLEPEILIVDEVLAVGDAQFQKKCLGKMEDVAAQGGRTVLFVSHSMSAISQLCSRVVFLESGKVNYVGDIQQGIDYYLASNSLQLSNSWTGIEGDEHLKLFKVCVYQDENGNSELQNHKEIRVRLEYELAKDIPDLIIGVSIHTIRSELLAHSRIDDCIAFDSKYTSVGYHVSELVIPGNTLANGDFLVKLDIGIHNVKQIINKELSFSVVNVEGIGRKFITSKWDGIFRPNWKWIIQNP